MQIRVPFVLEWRKLWILWVLVIVFVSTMPWSDFQGHSHWDLVRWIPFHDDPPTPRTLFDVVGNLLLYMPFGYLYVRYRLCLNGMVFLRVTLLAALFSVGGELFQVFTHYRIASVTDVCSNVIGAAIGVAIAMKLIKRGKVHRFSYKGNS